MGPQSLMPPPAHQQHTCQARFLRDACTFPPGPAKLVNVQVTPSWLGQGTSLCIIKPHCLLQGHAGAALAHLQRSFAITGLRYCLCGTQGKGAD